MCEWTDYHEHDARVKELQASIDDIKTTIASLRAQVPRVREERDSGYSEEYIQRKQRRLEGLEAKIERLEEALHRKRKQRDWAKQRRSAELSINRVIAWAGSRTEQSLWTEMCLELTGQVARSTLECNKQILAELSVFINIFDHVEGRRHL